MKKIDVTIKGLCPLLHNRFPTEEHGQSTSKAKKKVYDPNVEAEKRLYKDEKGQIYQPAEHIFQAMVKASTRFKFEGKRSYKDLIYSGIAIEPECIPLNKKKWDEIDTRAVVIQRARVVTWRPKFNDWKVSFKVVIYDDENISVPIIKDILDAAGKYVGIGDYRPRFGRFMLTEFKEVS